MTKDKLKGLKDLFALASLITAIGFILLFFSVNFGTSVAGNWLDKHNETAYLTYQIVRDGSINNFLAAGSILFGIGFATIIFAYYKILNINE